MQIESKIISDTLSFVQDLAVFTRHSPLRMSTYEEHCKQLRVLGRQRACSKLTSFLSYSLDSENKGDISSVEKL